MLARRTALLTASILVGYLATACAFIPLLARFAPPLAVELAWARRSPSGSDDLEHGDLGPGLTARSAGSARDPWGEPWLVQYELDLQVFATGFSTVSAAGDIHRRIWSLGPDRTFSGGSGDDLPVRELAPGAPRRFWLFLATRAPELLLMLALTACWLLRAPIVRAPRPASASRRRVSVALATAWLAAPGLVSALVLGHWVRTSGCALPRVTAVPPEVAVAGTAALLAVGLALASALRRRSGGPLADPAG